MEKTNTSIYIEEEHIDRVENDDDWTNLSQLVSYLLHEYYISNTISNTPDDTHVSDLEERMDTFDERAQRAFDTRDQRLDSLRKDVEELREEVERLKGIADDTY